MGMSKEKIDEIRKSAKTHPLKICIYKKYGHIVGIPEKLRDFKDPIFNLMPGTVNIAVEIGTCQGWFAYRMAKYLSDSARIFCIDPFYNEPDEKYDGEYNLKCWKKNVRESFGKKIFLKRGESFAESQRWGSLPVDFLFIDGDHKQEAVTLDLEGWIPKVRPGGLIAGHDIDGQWGDQVKGAVESYCSKNGITKVHVGKVYSFTGTQTTNCWWFYQPVPPGDKK